MGRCLFLNLQDLATEVLSVLELDHSCILFNIVLGFLFLREAYITNLRLLACLEPFEKFVVVGGGGCWSRPILVLSLVPKLNNFGGTVIVSQLQNRMTAQTAQS